MGEGDKDVVLNAGARGHVVLCFVKFVVASLRASHQLGKWVVLDNKSEIIRF